MNRYSSDTVLEDAGIKRRELSFFLLVTFAFSWVVWSPLFVPSLVVAMPLGGIELLSLGAFGPAVGGLAVVRSRGDNVRSWLKRRFHWRVGFRWYLLVFGLPVGILLVGGMIFVVVGGELTHTPPLYVLPLVFVYATVIGGGQEEIGWRGVAQPLVEGRCGVFGGGAVVGLFWVLWHIPLLASSTLPFESTNPVVFSVQTVGISVLLAWLYDGAERSVVLAMLFHGWRNATEAFYPPDTLARIIAVAVIWTVVLVVVTAERRRTGRA